MKILKLMSRAAIFASIATAAQAGAGAMVAMPDSSSAAADVAGQDRASIVHVQYGEERPADWNGRPGWNGDPPGQQNWPSQWGGGWYGGWYQPYWGQSGWASPNWTYGSPNYYGHYPAPSACGPNGCGQPAPDYPPLK